MAPVLELSIIFGFFALMLAIGFYHYFTAGDENERDYFIAGGGLGPFVGGFTYMATLFSMFTFLGVVGLYANIGVSFTNLLIGEAIIVAILIPTLGYKFWKVSHRRKHVTPSDIMADRFGDSSPVRILVAVALIGSMIMYLTIQYIGISLVLESTTDGFLSFNMVVLLMFLVGGIYVAIGGMNSVAITDTIQGVLLWAGLVILMGAMFLSVPPSEMAEVGLETLPALGGTEAEVGSIQWLSWSAELFAFGFGMFLWPQLWVRTFAAGSRKSLASMGVGMLVTHLVLIGFIGYFIALGGPITLGELPGNPDLIGVLFTLEYLPAWLAVLILTGGAAAALSTLDSVALVLGSIASRDLYQELIVDRDDISANHKENAGRVFAFLLMGIGAFLVFFGPTGLIAELLVAFGYPALAGIAPAVMLALYWKEATEKAAIVSMTASIVIVFFMTVMEIVPTYGIYPGGWTMLAGTVLMIGISLLDDESATDEIADAYDLR